MNGYAKFAPAARRRASAPSSQEPSLAVSARSHHLVSQLARVLGTTLPGQHAVEAFSRKGRGGEIEGLVAVPLITQMRPPMIRLKPATRGG